jgi:hypothetical protein
MREDFHLIARGLRARFEQVRLRAQGHPAETGTGREGILIDFLSQVLPARFSVGRGFICDSFGRRSRQVDVVVNDDQVLRPWPYDEGRALYFCDAVGAAVEVKSALTRNELESAAAGARAVKQLRRSPAKAAIRVMTHTEKQRADIILSYVFAFEAAASTASIKSWWADINQRLALPADAQIDAVIVLDKGVIFNIPEGESGHGVRVKGEPVYGLVGLEAGEDSLLAFYVTLLHQLPKVVFAQPNIWDYVQLPSYGVC